MNAAMINVGLMRESRFSIRNKTGSCLCLRYWRCNRALPRADRPTVKPPEDAKPSSRSLGWGWRPSSWGAATLAAAPLTIALVPAASTSNAAEVRARFRSPQAAVSAAASRDRARMETKSNPMRRTAATARAAGGASAAGGPPPPDDYSCRRQQIDAINCPGACGRLRTPKTLNHMLFGEPIGQSWLQLSELALAFVLSALIGLEREVRQKSAGLRTYTLVGVSSALIMLVSKYGFTDILENGRVVLDPSRIAAQIVTGIGFIGGGVIFVRKDYRSRVDDGIYCLAHSRGRHGRRRRAPNPCRRRDCRPFRRGVRLPDDRAAFAQITLGSVAAAHFLRGAPRRFERDPCRLHQSRIFGESCAG